jgi:hypothetical protein
VGRAGAAITAAVGPAALVAAGASAGTLPPAAALATLALAAGFLLRAAYRRARLPRLWLSATAGAVAVLYLWPGGGVPAATAIAALGSGAVAARFAAAHALVPLALAVAALASWAPATTSAGAGWLVWVSLAWAPTAPLLAAVAATEPPAHHLCLVVHAPLGLAAWYGLAAFGVASVVAKRLEHSES